LPFKILILSFVLALLGTHSDPNFAPSQVFHYTGKPEAGWLLFVTWMNVVAAGSLTMVTDWADFCRYTRSRANMFEVASGLTTSHFILLLFLVVIALDNWTINVLNLYTGGLSLSNRFERLGRFWTTLIISVLGIVLSAIPDVASGYTTYVGILGNVFSPIVGVLIADYLLVKGARIDLVALFEPNGSYWYWKGVNLVAVIWTAFGFLAYMFVIPAEWIQVVMTLLATGAGYWASMQLLAPRFIELFRGAHPGEQREAVEDLDWELALR
jgi:NCS1 family nucleobase:cation symporter-1